MSDTAKIQTLEYRRDEVFTVADESESCRLAERFVAGLQPGDVVALFGDLGTGKTALVRAMAPPLGYMGFVNSPTFSLLNIYPAAKLEIYHFDFYRINIAEEALDIGFDEYVQNAGICFIEWPEKIIDLLPEKRWEIHLEVPDYVNEPTGRSIRIRKFAP